MAESTAGAGILYGGMLWGRGSRTVDCKLFEYGRLSGVRTEGKEKLWELICGGLRLSIKSAYTMR